MYVNNSSVVEAICLTATASATAAVAIWAIPGVNLTVTGAAVAALVCKAINEWSPIRLPFLGLVLGHVAATYIGQPIGVIAFLVNTFAANLLIVLVKKATGNAEPDLLIN